MELRKHRRIWAGAAAATVVALIAVFGWGGVNGSKADSAPDPTQVSTVSIPPATTGKTTPLVDTTDPRLWPDLQVARLEDPGPGRCLPDLLAERRKEVAAGAFKQYEGGTNGTIDFVSPYSEYELKVLQADTVQVIRDGNINKDRPKCLEDLAKWLKDHEDYSQVSKVIGRTFDTTKRADLVDYYSKLKLVEIPTEMVVINHYFHESKGVVALPAQKFPKSELIYFVPGFEPGNKEGQPIRPINKFICLNPLLPPPTTPTPTPTTTTAVTTPTTTTLPAPTTSQTPTTTTPGTPTTTILPTTTVCDKCNPPTTPQPAPTTSAPAPTTSLAPTTTEPRSATTVQAPTTTQPGSGTGAPPNTVDPPTTEKPLPTIPTTTLRSGGSPNV